ncbi:hypothetical protein TNCV_4860531 [Trichonephila clavipes]|nr:hypothetical protein TNCV_4860531 [Trichonephila clavipes]
MDDEESPDYNFNYPFKQFEVAVFNFVMDNFTIHRWKNVWIKKLSLQEAFNLFQKLPSEISGVLTDDFCDKGVPANNPLEFSSDS